jgi:hypothetical protein
MIAWNIRETLLQEKRRTLKKWLKDEKELGNGLKSKNHKAVIQL